MPNKIYVGVESDVPVYGPVTNTQSIALTKNNLSHFFTVSGGSVGNSGWNITDYSSGTIQLKPGNIGVNSTTTTIKLTAKRAFDKDTKKIPQKKIAPTKNEPSPTKRKSSNSART